MSDTDFSLIRRRPEIVRREVGSEVLLFDPRDDSLHVLNASAAVVWDWLENSRACSELAGYLRQAFAVDIGVDVEGDVNRIVAELRGRDLVVEVES